MPIHEIVEPFSFLWWKGIASCFLVTYLIILSLRNRSVEFKEKTRIENKLLGYCISIQYASFQSITYDR